MKDLTNESIFNLANRINQINKEINQLQMEYNRIIDELHMEYNRIIDELHTRLPHLKDDVDLQPKVLRKIMED